MDIHIDGAAAYRDAPTGNHGIFGYGWHADVAFAPFFIWQVEGCARCIWRRVRYGRFLRSHLGPLLSFSISRFSRAMLELQVRRKWCAPFREREGTSARLTCEISQTVYENGTEAAFFNSFNVSNVLSSALLFGILWSLMCTSILAFLMTQNTAFRCFSTSYMIVRLSHVQADNIEIVIVIRIQRIVARI